MQYTNGKLFLNCYIVLFEEFFLISLVDLACEFRPNTVRLFCHYFRPSPMSAET